MTEFESFGKEWEAEINKLPKKMIIRLYRDSCLAQTKSIPMNAEVKPEIAERRTKEICLPQGTSRSSVYKWSKEKPDYACIFLTKHNSEYNLWRFCWQIGEPSEDTKGEAPYWYLAWTDQDGNEWDDISECNFDEYLILEILPTMEEAKKQWMEKQINYGSRL